MVVEFYYPLAEVMILKMDRIKDLFEAYGIAIGIVIETTGDFLSSVGQTIIDKLQPPLKYDDNYKREWPPIKIDLENPLKCVPPKDPEDGGPCLNKNCLYKNNKNLIDNMLHDTLTGKDNWSPALPKQEKIRDLSYEDPFRLKEITLGGDQPGLASEIAWSKRKGN